MKERYMSLTNLGEHYGVSRVVAGRFVRNVGLRDANGQPTEKALDGGFCQATWDDDRGIWFVTWHAAKTLGLIEQCIQDPATYAANRRREAERRRGKVETPETE